MQFRLSPATLIFFAFFLLLNHDLTLISILSAVLIHEMIHLIVLWLLGGNATSVTVTPMGLSIERTGLLSHRSEFVLSLSAPIVNLILAGFYSYFGFDTCTVVANMGFGLINLLPIYPLDGGKALRSLLQSCTTSSKALFISDIISHIFLIFFWMLGIAVTLVLEGNISMLMLSVGLFITIAPMGVSNK